MMKKSLILLFLIPIVIFAQDSTEDVLIDKTEDALHQEIVMSVLQQINEYDEASSFANERKITQFEALFESLNTMVVNDIPAIGNYNEQIPIEEYIKYMRRYYMRMAVSIDIHEISEIDFENENKGSLYGMWV